MNPIRTGKKVAIAAGAGVAGLVLLAAFFWKDFAVKYYAMKLQSTDEGVCLEALESLQNLGPKALPNLMQALRNENQHVRKEAAVAIAHIRPLGSATTTTLTAMLKDESPAVRASATLVFGLLARK